MNENVENIAPKQKGTLLKQFLIFAFSFLVTVTVVAMSFYKSNSLKELAFSFYSFTEPISALAQKDTLQLAKQLKDTKKRVDNLKNKIDALKPYEPYLIINTTKNNFVLRTRKKIIRENICSTGSYTLLDAGENQQWIFKTPKGQFRILGKAADPVWNKPDWAFVEEGLPVPPKNHPDRFEYGTLGDYALALGQGYLIHGTLYQRFLGLPVTHGCIRLGDEDLKIVYKNLDIGSKVFIF
jgi:L,D-transpeptidase ErfK/SrfK